MPFILPFIPAIIGGVSAGAGIYGAVKQRGIQKKALTAAERQREEELKLAKEELAERKRITAKIEGAVSRYLSGDGEGFSPEEFSLMQSMFLGDSARAYDNAGTSVRGALRARGGAGGDLPIGGDFVRSISGLEGAKSASEARGISDIRLKDAAQKLINRFNAAGLLQGNASLINPASLFQSSNNSLAIQAQLAGQGSPLSGALLGSGLNSLIGFDWSKIFGKKPPGGTTFPNPGDQGVG